MALATSDELVAYMRTPVGIDDSTLAQLALDAATEVILGYVGQEILTGTSSVVVDGTGTTGLFLPVFPVTAITSVKVRASSLEASTEETLVSGTDYTADLTRGILWRVDGVPWTEGKGNVTVVLTSGFSSTPADVKIVCLQVANRIYEIGQVESESTGSWSGQYVKGAASLTQDEKQILYRYRNA
jgi:hypothetical protein